VIKLRLGGDKTDFHWLQHKSLPMINVFVTLKLRTVMWWSISN